MKKETKDKIKLLAIGAFLVVVMLAFAWLAVALNTAVSRSI